MWQLGQITNELMFDFGNQYQDNVKEYNTILACGVHVRDVKVNTLNMLMISPFKFLLLTSLILMWASY